MKFLHSMIRVKDLDKSLDFFCNKLGMIEVRRNDYESGKFSLIFLSASGDIETAKNNSAPLVELTYNWPDKDGNTEDFTTGRNFGHLAFSVDNIYEYCQNLIDNGVEILRPPKDGYMAFIKSPDGISVELLQKGERLPETEPWSSMQNKGSW
jgi:lactoylglutathione lyase